MGTGVETGKCGLTGFATLTLNGLKHRESYPAFVKCPEQLQDINGLTGLATLMVSGLATSMVPVSNLVSV